MYDRYDFYWSPEGRRIYSIHAVDYKTARAAFKKACPMYAKFMGEVYHEVVVTPY